MRTDDAGFDSGKHGLHWRGVFRRIKFALVFNRFPNAGVLFHSNRFDPRHARRLLNFPVTNLA